MRRRSLKVILDYDDVLNLCNDMAVKRLGEEKGKEYSIEDITQWGPTGDELDERLAYFNDPEFMGSIPLRPGAKAFIYELSLMNVEIFIATSCASHCAGARVADIIRNFPWIDPGNILIGSRKDIILGDVMLDDGYHNLENAKVKYPVLFRRPWNRRITGIPAVNELREFLTIVRSLLNEHEPIAKGGKVISLIGPSGCGKSTIAGALVEQGYAEKVKSCTTRAPREGETDYHFVTKEEFLTMKENGEFLETTMYSGNYYGTSKKEINKILDTGKSAIVAVDINGAMTMKSVFKNRSLNIFVRRDKESGIRALLLRRLSVEETARRIATIDAELRNEVFCDFTVDNNGTVQDSVDCIVDNFLKEEA